MFCIQLLHCDVNDLRIRFQGVMVRKFGFFEQKRACLQFVHIYRCFYSTIHPIKEQAKSQNLLTAPPSFVPVLPRTPAMGIFPSSPRLRLGQDARRHLNSNLLPLRQKPDEIIPELMLSAAPSPFSHLQYSLESTPVFPETVQWPDVYPHPVSHQEQPLFPAVLQSGPRSPY